jgi:ABC-type microcin C transport system permease subunit YejB
MPTVPAVDALNLLLVVTAPGIPVAKGIATVDRNGRVTSIDPARLNARSKVCYKHYES